MVEVTYHCPYCGALTSIERDAYMADKCVTREPLDGWEYASTTDDYEAADGIEFVCLGNAAVDSHERHPETAGEGDGSPDHDDSGATSPDHDGGGAGDPDHDADGCGRTFYLSFVKFEDGELVEHRQPNVDRPRFDFLR